MQFEKRIKISERRPGLAHFLKKTMSLSKVLNFMEKFTKKTFFH